MLNKYSGKTWTDKDGIEWYREVSGGFLINLLADKLNDLIWWVEERVFKYQLLTDVQNLQGITDGENNGENDNG